jgi:two-component system, OmpR family, osmolarity sensor histidine kinase EnvZ
MNRKFAVVAISLAYLLLLSTISIVLLQRHWDSVARRLSVNMVREMAAIVDLYEASTTGEDIARLVHIGLSRFGMSVGVLPAGDLPAQPLKPFFDPLDSALSEEIRTNIKRPFWIDTVGWSREVEVRIKLEQATLRFVAPRQQAYVSNSHIFLVWMIGTSAIVLTIGYLAVRPTVRAI